MSGRVAEFILGMIAGGVLVASMVFIYMQGIKDASAACSAYETQGFIDRNGMSWPKN